ECEPFLVALGRADADLDRHSEIADDPLDDRRLLGILLAEVSALGVDEVEELQANGGDGAEVTGAVHTFEDGAEVLDLDPGLEAWRVDLFGGRDEENVDAFLLGKPGVALLVAGIAVEILAGAELGRVHEQA